MTTLDQDPLADELAAHQLPLTTWADDYRDRVNPSLMTDLLHQSVPVLRFSRWHLVETAEGYARSVLPLTTESTNHQGTHQGALMLMAADYTGAVALGSLLRGFPIAGLHPLPAHWPVDRALGWLARADIEYKAPSTTDLLVTCRVPAEQVDRIRARFFAGRPTLVPLEVSMEAEGMCVARAVLTFYVRRSSFIKPSSGSDRPNVMYTHLARSSARLLAGLRALEQTRAKPLFVDPYSAPIAGAHGRLLADQFVRILPELVDMVAARTRDADDCLRHALQAGVRQVVLVGAGLDCRPFRMLADYPDTSVFELDLEVMLPERERALARLPGLPSVRRIPVAIDLTCDDIAQRLLQTREFNPFAPALFIVEGVSMYLEERVVADQLRSIASLMEASDSRLWLDLVHSSVVQGTTGSPELETFLAGMARIGEPFIFGLDNPATYFEALGLHTCRSTRSSAFHAGASNPVFSVYGFHELRARA